MKIGHIYKKIDQHKISWLLAFSFILVSLFLITFFGLTIYNKYRNNKSKEVPPVATPIQKPAPIEDSYNLIIEKINITAPIIINVDGNDQEAYDKSLENGVAHLKGSSLPGKPGNPFIFGHSSFYAWKPGNYKEIFKDLNNIEVGDQILINSNLSRYIYGVIDKKIVLPDQVEVASQNYTENKLTLMTCWPIGTTDKRLVIISTLKETIPVQ
jgi:LPXTG-site transpeptidase (sortase) family protein